MLSILRRVARWITSFRLSFNVVEDYLGLRVPKLNICLSSFLLGLAVAIYALVFSYFTVLRHYCFQSSAWDLGIFTQSLYTTGFHGKLLGYTLEQPSVNPSGSFLGIHFSPILFLLVPLYRLAPYAETLLILQSIVLATGAVSLYAISHHLLENRFASLSLAISYLLYTPLHGVNWFDFHVQAFVPLFFFSMYYFYLKKNFKTSFLFLLLSLSTIEMMPVLVLPFGFYCLLSNRTNRRIVVYSLALMCTSIVFFMLASSVKAYLNPMHSTTFGAWQIWGSGYLQILGSVVTNPVGILTYFFTAFPMEKLLYFLWLMVPLLFLPLYSTREFVLLAMPWIALVFLSTYTGYFVYHYAAFVIAQIFISSVYGLKRMSKLSGKIVMKEALIFRYSEWALIGIIIAFILISPFGIIPQAKQIYVHGLPENTPHKEVLRQMLQLIPNNASVYTSFHIAPHLVNRLELYAHSVPDKPPDYIVIDLKSPDSIISLGVFGGTPIAGMKELLGKYNYSLMASIDGILIYSLDEPNTTIFEALTISFSSKDLILDSGKAAKDDTSISGMVLAHSPGDSHYGFWHSPYVVLPQGRYEAVYRVKYSELSEGHLLTFDITSDSGEALLARKHVYDHDIAPNAWNDVILEFSINEAMASIEFRGTYVSGETTHYLDSVTLTQTSPSADVTFGSISLNYMDFEIVQGKTIQDGVIIHQIGDPNNFLFGHYAKLPPGNYQIEYWLRLDMPYQGQISSLGIQDFNGIKLTEKEVFAEDFDQLEQWQCFSLRFTLHSSTSIVEIRSTCIGDVSIRFSYLEVFRVIG